MQLKKSLSIRWSEGWQSISLQKKKKKVKLIPSQKEDTLHGKDASLSAIAALTETAVWSAAKC